MREGFGKYLNQSLKYSQATIQDKQSEINNFFQWVKSKKKASRRIKHLDVVEYINHLKARGLTHGTISNKIVAIKHYYNFLGVKVNPVDGIKLRGREKSVLKGILTEEQLLKIYSDVKQWEGEDEHVHRKNLVILGLVIFQGATFGEIDRIRPIDVGLGTATVRLLGGKRSNGRTLPLSSHQVIDLYEYIEKSRRELLLRYGRLRANTLIFSRDSKDTQPMVSMLSKKLREKNKSFESFGQLRNSVIVNWLKNGENLRIVQYKAGHRYVSSTERFKMGNIEALKKKVIDLFPM